MKKLFTLLCMALFTGYAANAQTNIALTATASHTVGGATTYGPQNYNDGVISAAPATLPWGWTNTNGFIEYTWTTVQTGITKIKVWKADRPMGSCDIQYWNGSSYVTVMTWNTSISNPVDSVILSVPITTTQLRLNNVAGSSNPNHREIEVFAGPPCFGPTATSVTNVLSTSATASWSPVSGSIGYQYLVTTTPTPVWPYTVTPTTSLTASLQNLTPSTTYYFHVLNQCSSNNFSGFVTTSFTTLPPCKAPVNFKVLNLQTTSATISWGKWPSANNYDYIVNQDRENPGASTGAINTLDTFANLTSLTENTWYYVHIRSNCAASERSDWSLDSFITPVPCRAPQIHIDHLNTNQAVAWWDPVPSAQWYEYAITQMSIPPVSGTKYNFTSLHTAALDDGAGYYIHARCKCVSVGVEAFSPWGSASFSTWPVGISNVNGAGEQLEVYPNPVKSMLTVKLAFDAPAGAMLSITDITGKTVKQMEVKSSTVQVDMNSLAEGIYLVKYNDGMNVQVTRVVKQ